MAADRKYIVGQYEEYYNSLRGEGNASSKASSFISDVNTLVTEFSNISSIMTYWSGEAKDAMTNEAMASILKEFSITQKNMQESLGPACEAIDYLSQALELMKSKEDELLQAENELEALKSNEPSKEKTNPNYDKNNPNSKQTIHNDAYDTWLKNVEEKNTLITQITKELDEMKEDIDKAIKTIEDLESTLTEFSNYMNLTGSVLGVGDSDKFKGYTLEERLKYIQNIIDNYQTIYNSLNDVYQKQYGKGFSFSAEDFENLDVIFQAFDIYWMSGMDNGSLKTSGNNENVLLDIEKLNKIVTYCNNSGIFTYIEKYLDGASWKDSGLQDFYWENSPNFLKIGVFGENDLKNRLKQKYGVEESNVRSFLKEKYESYKGSYENLMKDYSEYRQLAGTMATIKEKIRDLERGKKLIPFEMEMENDDFVKYLEKDYSGSTLLDAEKRSVMTQKELALYDYLLHNKSKEEANAYMDAMENAINQRIGAQRATNYVNSLRENGFDAWDLLNSGATGVWDGIRSFDQGIRSLFTAATLEEGEKSTLDWELQYKQQFIQQLMNDPSYIDQNTNKQWHGWTDLSAWYNTGTSIGNMAIPAVVGMIPGCQGLSSALFGASIMGNTAAEAKYEGYSTAQAYIYGGVTALSEVVTEKMLGGIDGLSEKALGRNIFQNMFSEGLEEFTQEYLDLGARRLILGEKIDLSASGINAQLVKSGESFKYGAFTSGVMGIANRGTGKVLNAVTKAASPVKIDSKTHEVVMESDNKTPAKKYNTYQEYKNAVESKHDVNKATKVFENTIDKVKSGQDLTLTEKVKLNNAIGDLSVQELSQVTDSLSSKTGLDTKQILQSASEGVAVLSKKSGSKFEAADLYNQVMDENVDLKDVKFTKNDFKDEVTRDGKKLGDIIAEERANSLTSEARANIESVSKSEMKSIDKTIDKRQKLYEKEVKKALKQELKNTTATVRENVETQSTNTDGLDTRVQQNTTTQQSSTVQQSAAVEQAAVQAAIQTQTQVEQRTQTQQNSESRQQTQVEQQGDNRVYNSAENTADVRLNEDSQTENNTVAAIQGIAQNAMQQAQAAQLQTEQTSSQETTSDSGSEVKLDTNAVKEAAGGVSLAATAAMSVNSLVGANSRASANANVDTQNNVKNNARVEGQTRTVGTATNNSTSQTQTSTRTTTDTTTRFNSDSRTSTRTNQNIEYRSSENSVVTSSDSVQNGTQTSTQLNTTALLDIKSLNTDTVSKMTGNDVANLVNEIANNPKLVQDLNSLLKDNQTVKEAFSDKLEEVFKNNNVSNLSFAEAVNQANYKSTIVENLINTGLINSISDNSVAVIISSDVSSSEILNTQRAVDIFDKYIQQTSTAEAVFNMYSKADNQVLNNFLQNQEVSNTIKSLDSDLLLRVASKNSSWMNLNVLNEEISNRFNSGEVAFKELRNKKIISDINSMNESSNTIYSNGNYSADSPQIIRYTLNTGETITIDLGDTKSGNIFDAKGINELFSQMEQKNVTNLVIKNKYNVKVLENMINNLAGERICNTYSKSYKTAEVVTTDNKTIKIELSNFVTTDNFIDIYNAVATNQVKSLTITENVARNNLILDGIDSKNVYEVTVNIDGKEQTIYTSFGDLNTNFKNVTTAEVLNVREVGNFDCEVNDVTMPVKVSFDANGVHYEKYVQPTVGKLTYEINDFIKYGGIQNVQNVQVEYVTQEQLKSTFKEKYVNYDTRPESRALFSEQYGGNQSDVSGILTKSLNKQAMTPIEQQKAQILETISDKYYSNLTDIQKINLAEFYNTNGCFYMATANSFASYMSSIPGGEQIFKSNFGFDLFTEVDGKRVLNIEAIAYDLFLSQTEDMSYYEFLDTTPGTNFNFGAILNNYFSNHGINVDYSSTIDNFSTIGENHSVDGLKNKSMAALLNNSNRYNILLASKFDMDQMTFDGSEQSVIKDAALANSQQIGNKRINVGGHAMLVTGIDANGDIEVSSWGKKFKIDLTSYDVSKNRIDQDFNFASIGFDINQNLRFNQDSVAAVQQVAAQNSSSSMEFNSSDTAFDSRTGLDFAEPLRSTIELVTAEPTSIITTSSNSEVVSQVENDTKTTRQNTTTFNSELKQETRKNTSTNDVIEAFNKKRASIDTKISEPVSIDIEELPSSKEIAVPDTFGPDDWVLVRSTEFLPVDGKIQTPFNAGASGVDSNVVINSEEKASNTFNRHTVHFALNGLVEGGFVGAADWNSNPYFVIEPFKYHQNSSFMEGFVGDMYFNEDVKLSKEAVILVNKEYFQSHKAELPSEYNYVLFEGEPKNAIGKVINSMGYINIKNEKRIDDYKNNDNGTKMNEDFKAFLNEKKFISSMHDGTANSLYEKKIGTVEALLEYLRNKPINMNDGVILSESELDALAKTFFNNGIYDTKMGKYDFDSQNQENIQKNILNRSNLNKTILDMIDQYGLKYNPETKDFSIVGYNEYLERKSVIHEIKNYDNYVREYELLENSLNNPQFANRFDFIKERMEVLKGNIDFINNNIKTYMDEVTSIKEKLIENVKAESESIKRTQSDRDAHISELQKIKEYRENRLDLKDTLKDIGLNPNESFDLNISELMDLAQRSGVNVEDFIRNSGIIYDTNTGSYKYIGLNDIEGMRQVVNNSSNLTNYFSNLSMDELLQNKDLIVPHLLNDYEFLSYTSEELNNFVSVLDENQLNLLKESIQKIIEENPNITRRTRDRRTIDNLFNTIDERMRSMTTSASINLNQNALADSNASQVIQDGGIFNSRPLTSFFRESPSTTRTTAQQTSQNVDVLSGRVDSTVAYMKDVSQVVKILYEKYNYSTQEAFDIIERAALTGKLSSIPTTNGARDILRKYTRTEILQTLNTMRVVENVSAVDTSKIEYVIRMFMEEKNLPRSVAIQYIKNVVDFRNFDLMTTYGDSRSVLQKMGFENVKAAIQNVEVKEFLRQRKINGINEKYGKPVVIRELTRNVDFKYASTTVQNMFDNAGTAETSTYGVNQGLMYEMFRFSTSEGVYHTYREAQAIVKQTIAQRGVMPSFRKYCSQEYFDFKQKMMTKYNLSANDVSVLITCIDNSGACSYAAVCNEIYSKFINDEVGFQRTFGFPMYTFEGGQKVFNAKELMFDLYLNSNSTRNGGTFVIQDAYGTRLNQAVLSTTKVDPLGRRIFNTDDQSYLSNAGGKNIQLIDGYLRTKGLGFNSYVLKGYQVNIDTQQMSGLLNRVMLGISEGRTYGLGLYSKGVPITMYAPEGANYNTVSTANWNEGAGHAVYITGMTEEGFIVSSWGQKYIISYSDLLTSNQWVLNEDVIAPNANPYQFDNRRYNPRTNEKIINDGVIEVNETQHNNKEVITVSNSSVETPNIVPESGIGIVPNETIVTPSIQHDVSVHNNETTVQEVSNEIFDVEETSVSVPKKTVGEIISSIDEDEAVSKLKALKTPKQEVSKFQEILKKAKEIVVGPTFKQYNKKLTVEEIVSTFADQFGDGGAEVNELLREGKIVSEIRSILIERGSDVEAFDKFISETPSGKFLSQLNSRQLSALRRFTGAGLHQINETIRILRENSQHMFAVDDIYDALSNAPELGYDMLVYRGTNTNALTFDKDIRRLLNGVDLSNSEELYIALKNVVGLKIRDLGFLSTSPGYQTSFAPRENKNVVFEIIVPNGTKGAYINQLSDFYNRENEYLLSYGTTLRILNVSYDSDGKIHIQCIVEDQLTPSI